MPAVWFFSCKLLQEVCVIASHEERITLSVGYQIYQRPYFVTLVILKEMKNTWLDH